MTVSTKNWRDNGERREVTLIPKSWPAWAQKALAVFGSAGVGATIAITLIDKEHHFIVETFRSWGAPSLLGLVAILLVSQGASRVLDLGERMLLSTEKTAASQQQLADAVQALVSKDDREKEEQRRLLSYVGTQQEKILTAIDELKQASARSRGASA